MFAVAPAFGFLLALLQAGVAPASSSESLPVRFAPRTALTQPDAAAGDDEVTIAAGAGAPYLSSIPVGEFEASGEIAMPAEGIDAALVLFATVERDVLAHATIRVALPAVAKSGWQPMTVSSANNRVRVSIGDRIVAERDVEGEAYGLFGFDVARGSISLRRWRVSRRDAYRMPFSSDDLKDVVRATPPGGNVQAPRLRQEVKPQYTPEAMRRKVQGNVQVEAIVETDGTIGPVHVLQGLDDDLDRQAVAALKQWQFEPALVDGHPVRCRVTVVLSFTLRGR